MSTIASRWSRLPRAARWLIAFGAVTLGYFAVVEPVLDATNRMNARAEGVASTLARYREQAARLREAEGDIALGVRRFGVVHPPGDANKSSTALVNRIDDILRGRGVTSDWTIRTRRAVALGRGALFDVLAENPEAQLEVSRLMVELQIPEASPEAVMGVIADLESSPEVTAVSQVQIRRVASRDGGGRMVQATIIPEVWVISRKESAR